MFKTNFIKYCNKIGVAPTVVCRQIGLTASSFSLWTDESVPRKATLMKLADYFGVTVEDLLADEPPQIEKAPAFTFDERTENNVAKILALIADFSDDQLDFLISVMEDMPHLSDNQLKVVTAVMRNMRK